MYMYYISCSTYVTCHVRYLLLYLCHLSCTISPALPTSPVMYYISCSTYVTCHVLYLLLYLRHLSCTISPALPMSPVMYYNLHRGGGNTCDSITSLSVNCPNWTSVATGAATCPSVKFSFNVNMI